MFSTFARAMFENLMANPPRTEDLWYLPWDRLLSELLPKAQNYDVGSGRRFRGEDGVVIPDFYANIHNFVTPAMPWISRTVLIVEIKKSSFRSGYDALAEQVRRQVCAAFHDGSAQSKVYWIEAVGPRWRYGECDDQLDHLPLSGCWHESAHDLESYLAFQTLAQLISQL